jgi:putative transposase
LPVYKLNNPIKYDFSGKRISRGQYRSKIGIILNADINGALNILKKSNAAHINLIQNGYLNPQRVNLLSTKKENKKIHINNTCKLVA